MGSGLLDPPVKTKYGDWYLMLPAMGIGMGPLSGTGLCTLEVGIPDGFSTPTVIPLQTLLGSELTKPIVINVDG